MHPGGGGGKKRLVGAGLSLDKWATAKISKYDKRKVVEKQQQLKAKQVNKYKKLKKRLEAEGRLQAPLPIVVSTKQQHTAAATNATELPTACHDADGSYRGRSA